MRRKPAVLLSLALIVTIVGLAWEPWAVQDSVQDARGRGAETEPGSKSVDAVGGSEALVSARPGEDREEVGADSPRSAAGTEKVSRARVLRIRVVDAVGEGLAGVEACFVPTARTDRDLAELAQGDDARALEFARVRRSLWQVGSFGLLQSEEVLGKVFGVPGSVRSDAEGYAILPYRPAASVLALWSPEIGLRFRAPPEPRDEPVLLRCETWPRIHGVIATEELGAGRDPRIRVALDAEDGHMTRVLTLDLTQQGEFKTPQLPPGRHLLAASGRDFRYTWERFKLTSDRHVRLQLPAYPVFRVRLVDPQGAPWDEHRLATLGVRAETLRVELRRKRVRSHVDRVGSASPSELQFERATGHAHGSLRSDRQLELSVWSGDTLLGAARLPGHDVADLAIELRAPPSKLTVSVAVSFEPAPSVLPHVGVQAGVLSGPIGASFRVLARARIVRDRYLLDLPGYVRGTRCHVLVKAEGFATAFLPVDIPERGDCPTIWASMALAPHTLRGRVVDANGQGIPRARVTIADAEGRRLLRAPRESSGSSSADGSFVFDRLPRARVRVFARARGFASTSVLVDVGHGATARLVLEPGQRRALELGALGREGVQLRVLNTRGETLRDDRVQGALRYGEKIGMRLSSRASVVEVWRLGGTAPLKRISLR